MTENFNEWAEKAGERYVPEREYQQASESRRRGLADQIRESGLSYIHIANATRVGRKVVARAAQGTDIRQEAFDRIHYYLGEVAPKR